MNFAGWLGLREPADAAARATDLVRHLPSTSRWVIHDLGCGTGAMGRWLAPLLPGPQHWVLHDRDEQLLEVASVPGTSLETRRSDIAQLCADDLAGATLVTASALLDVLTEEEVERLVTTCAATGCPALLTLSVVGRVELDPPDPLDRRVGAAFNDHQRRSTRRGRLAGPDAVASAAERFRAFGAEVLVRPSPWRLGRSEAELAAAWFNGWVDAACEQQPELVADAAAYTSRRLEQARAGRLAVTVHHADLLAQSTGKRGESA
jgi:hypothetical protein